MTSKDNNMPTLASAATGSSSSSKEETQQLMNETKPKADSPRLAADASVATDHCEYDAALESMDSCVSCIEGVHAQNEYEMELDAKSQPLTALSEEETTMIRLQIMEEQREQASASPTNSPLSDALPLPDLDLLNLCSDGDQEDMPVFLVPDPCTFSDAGKEENRRHRSLRSKGDIESAPSIDTDKVVKTHGMSSLASQRLIVGKVCTTGLAPATTQEEEEDENKCAICQSTDTYHPGPLNNETDDIQKLPFQLHSMPCCSGGGCSVAKLIPRRLCTPCLVFFTQPSALKEDASSSPRVGRCPLCRSWLMIVVDDLSESYISIEPIANTGGKCHACHQVKPYLILDDKVCDACFLGRRQPLLYDCENCHHTQSIPHPLYRYQSDVDTFATVSWPCQGDCGNYTRWRIRQDQLKLIPLGDYPEEWKLDDLQIAQDRIRKARYPNQEAQQDGHATVSAVSTIAVGASSMWDHAECNLL